MIKISKFKIIVSLIIVILLSIILLILNSIYGNPISKSLAEQAADEYMSNNYSDTDFFIEEIVYNFKDGDYYARVKSPSSQDSYFDFRILMTGEINYDSYESVLSGWNTYRRIDKKYNEMVGEIFSSEEFPLKSDIDYGKLEYIDEKYRTNRFDEPNYGLDIRELELDKEYDIKALGEKYGHIVFYAQDDEISYEKASELLLILKEALDSKDVPFYAISFVLEKPRMEDGSPNRETEAIYTSNFLYSDIYEEGLALRLEKAHNDLKKYYEEQDSKNK